MLLKLRYMENGGKWGNVYSDGMLQSPSFSSIDARYTLRVLPFLIPRSLFDFNQFLIVLLVTPKYSATSETVSSAFSGSVVIV